MVILLQHGGGRGQEEVVAREWILHRSAQFTQSEVWAMALSGSELCDKEPALPPEDYRDGAHGF